MAFDGSGTVSLGARTATTVNIGSDTATAININSVACTFNSTNTNFLNNVGFGGDEPGTVTFNCPVTFNGTVDGLTVPVGVNFIKTDITGNSNTVVFVVTSPTANNNNLSSHTLTWQCANYDSNNVLVGAIAGTTTLVIAYFGTTLDYTTNTVSTDFRGSSTNFLPIFTAVVTDVNVTTIQVSMSPGTGTRVDFRVLHTSADVNIAVEGYVPPVEVPLPENP